MTPSRLWPSADSSATSWLSTPATRLGTVWNDCWATRSFAALFDLHIPDWKSDPVSLRYAVRIPLSEIGWAHRRAKRQLIDHINRESRAGFDVDALTIGFARRATAYKRPTLIFHDVERLARLAETCGPLQLVFAGKAHPRDEQGKASIREIFAVRKALRGRVGVTYLANHDMQLGKLLPSGPKTNGRLE